MTFLELWVGGLDAWVLGLLAATAFATSVLSAIVGMAGGITLLAVMLLFFDPLVAIPLHGIVQLVSNSSRTVAQRSHVRWDIVWRYALPLLPLGWLGLLLAESISPDVARLIIGVFVLVATWRPAWMSRCLVLLRAPFATSKSADLYGGSENKQGQSPFHKLTKKQVLKAARCCFWGELTRG